jgi:hypothetical protein
LRKRWCRYVSSRSFIVTTLAQHAEPGADLASESQPADPNHNPSYPRRIHFLEITELEETLRACDERINAAFQKLGALGNHAQKPLFTKLYHQLEGTRDQIAESVRRLPLETGGLYQEDRERFQRATEALERIWRRWQEAGG